VNNIRLGNLAKDLLDQQNILILVFLNHLEKALFAKKGENSIELSITKKWFQIYNFEIITIFELRISNSQ